MDGGNDERWQDLRKGHPLAMDLFAYTALAGGFMLVAWAIHAVVLWQDFLRGPVALIVLGFNVLLVLVVIMTIRTEIKRRDTATQSIRAASQGRIELVGMVRAVGEPLVSPLYGVKCIAYRSVFRADSEISFKDAIKGKPTPDPVTFSEEVFQPAFLLTDGKAEVFVPLERGNFSSTEILLDKDDEPLDTIRSDVAAHLQPRMTVTSRGENVIPVGKLVMVNGVFRTLSSEDSYQRVSARHREIMEPSDEGLAHDPVEQAWLAHCRRKAAEAGGGVVQIDVVLPITHFLGLPVVRATEPSWRTAVKDVATMLVVLIPGAYLAARLLDWIPELLLF